MTVIVTPLTDHAFRFAVACALDRIAAGIGVRPDELVASPSLALQLQRELRQPDGTVWVSDSDALIVTRAEMMAH